MLRARALSPLFVTFATLAACNNDGGSGDAGTAPGETTGGPTGAPTTDVPMTTSDATTGATTDVPTTGVDPESCGNGALDPGETCDGPDLGGKACVDAGPYIGGTLACAADCKSLDASGCDLAPGTGVVALNEVAAGGAADGPYLDKGDIIELFNAGDAALDLSGYKLADDMTFPPDKTYVFPDGTMLAPGEWLVLVELDPDTLEGNFPFGLAQDKEETLVLADADGAVVDSLAFHGAMAKKSYCRVPDGKGAWAQCEQTFGAVNAAALTSCGDGVAEGDEVCDGDDFGGATCEALGFMGGGALACTIACTHDLSACSSGNPLVINELEAAADDIELYNSSDKAIDVAGWILTDDAVGQNYDPDADLEKVVFAGGTTVPAKGFFVVHKGEDPNYHPFGLSSDGDTVTLLKPDLTIVDQVTYGPMQADLSYCRMPDGPDGAWTAMCMPTLDLPNKAG